MDATDRAIIDELRRDARIANVELAERVSLSPSACLRRVRALEQSGVIRGYHAEIDPDALGRAFEIEVMIELTQKDRATVEAFERRIVAMDPVIECRRMFGLPDYLIRVAVADTAAYEAFYMNELAELPGIGRVSSQFTMKLVK
ncbi:MAG TPA: Lrp/AsnC family transcriptional regulator [Solirubrobacteraceae bacterium]|nr:Lrp/AsnC family transcriptional regulator [Solirubrobacteraceae bacterium]